MALACDRCGTTAKEDVSRELFVTMCDGVIDGVVELENGYLESDEFDLCVPCTRELWAAIKATIDRELKREATP